MNQNEEARKLFKNGLNFLTGMEIKEALTAFNLSFRKSRNPKSLGYYLYALLLDNDYNKLGKVLPKNKTEYGDFGVYAEYWLKFMNGELDTARDCLESLNNSENYFLRIYSLAKLSKRKTLPASDFYGLSYESHFEEKRGSVYLDILNKRYNLALLEIKSLLKEHPAFVEFHIDTIETVSGIAHKNTAFDIINDPAINEKALSDFRLAYVLSRELYKHGNYEQAKIYLKKLVSKFKNNPAFHFNIGNIYFKEGANPKAIEHYRMAVTLAPLFERAYYNLGTALLKSGYVRDSTRYLEDAIKLTKRPDAVYNLSVCLIKSRQLEEAYRHLHYLGRKSAQFKDNAADIKTKIRQAMILSA